MTPQLPLTINRQVTLKTYIDIRDSRLRELSTTPVVSRLADAIGRLELCNNVVRTLLNERHESVERFLELLRCDACELFIIHARRELRAENRQSPVPINEADVIGHLKVALATDSELIPQPAPSSAFPIQSS